MAKTLENLDCMTANDLTGYIAAHARDPRYATEIAYATAIRDAMELRERGNITRATLLERQADRLYDTLSRQEQW